ncbi:MAG TPA: hypothetical protein VF074_18615, partial [Pyrinomonadaceae bacterium]
GVIRQESLTSQLMNGARAAPQTDQLLMPLLTAANEAESQSVLAQLLSEQASPIIKGIINEKLHIFRTSEAQLERQDAEDVHSEVMAQILARLTGLRDSDGAETILDFRGYVATATSNACHQYLRRKYPQRWRLKNRLRYLLTHRPEFAVWQDDKGKQLCGFAAWRERDINPVTDEQLTQLRGEILGHLGLDATSKSRIGALNDLLVGIFEGVNGPVEIDALVTTVAHFQGIIDHPISGVASREGESPTLEESLPDTKKSVAVEFELRSYLQCLWSEIVKLPLTQRKALLLNLKDLQEGVIALLPLTGAATFRDIAAALAMTAEDLVGLWNKLPLDDATIADQLGLTRQQVINLRKSARARLARRMTAFDEAKQK